MVARGIVCNQRYALLHNLHIPENHVKVRIDFAIVGAAPLHVQLNRANITTVEDAIGTYVMWHGQYTLSL